MLNKWCFWSFLDEIPLFLIKIQLHWKETKLIEKSNKLTKFQIFSIKFNQFLKVLKFWIKFGSVLIYFVTAIQIPAYNLDQLFLIKIWFNHNSIQNFGPSRYNRQCLQSLGSLPGVARKVQNIYLILSLEVLRLREKWMDLWRKRHNP